jgi:hypothetical protein
MSDPLERLLQHPSLWRAGGQGNAQRRTISSGHAELDSHLPGGGWPFPALIELLVERWGVGELTLLVPALRQLTNDAVGSRAHLLAWLNPPHIPYAPALVECGLDPATSLVTTPLTAAQTLWATEQALRSGACTAALAWVDRATTPALRRLKLATQEVGCLGVLFRSARARTQASPANLRLALTPQAGALHVELVKVQGGKPAHVRISI